MPHISIKLYPGRSEEVKKNLAEKMRDCLAEELKMPPNVFSVSIKEIEKEHWDREVVQKLNHDEVYVEANL